MNAATLEAVAKTLCQQRNATLVRILGAGAHKLAFLIQEGIELRALKIAPITGSLKPRFERETQALKDCSHPSIAKLYDVVLHADGGTEFWVSVEEYLPNGTLAERLSAGPLTTDNARAIGIELADALGHMQSRGFVHRDIKPANILFNADHRPVITDFGIVRFLDAPSLTHDFIAQGPGTPLYSAPEQLLNDKHSIDWRTDQFGLALVLAECVLGQHPYAPQPGANRDAVMAMAARVPLPTATRDVLQAQGIGCLVKALSVWPVDRFRTPAQFIEALKGAA